ncbi:MAG: peptidase C1 [Ignavibacteriales bacterium CG_4_9_14_3_um_filter_34_10]|nr:MAG: peptidase C1 [Ignavibacteriales bacterium CG_4_9_14_3_um_filter_34_10]
MKRIFIILLAVVFAGNILAQSVTKGKYEEPKKGFYSEISEGIKEFNKTPEKDKRSFKADFTGLELPKSVAEFKSYWHTSPDGNSQGSTGTCWDYCGTSFFESEIYRLSGQKIKLSEMYTAYWEYVEKTKRFIRERGNSAFGEGSESENVTLNWKKYGVVPIDSYTGLLPGQKFHNHSKMFDEMNSFLQSLKSSNNWNEELAASTIKSIMNHYMGVPPTTVKVNGKELTPKEYVAQVLKINLDNYIQFISTTKFPFYQKAEFVVTDNWWHSDDYYNVPLDDFMAVIKKSIRNGYTICIGGDVSEPGIEGFAEVAMIPEFDIPSDYINQDAREYRFVNGTTGDDHGIHLVGYKEQNGKDWYLIKDSGAGARNGNNKGYYFYQEDFVKLKMLSFMVCKGAVGDLLKKLK